MQIVESDRFHTWVYVSALVAISLISRLPQLLSPNLLLDGDECILGLMAKHIAEGRAFPVFLYGQPYGLSVVEAPAGALSFIIAGTGALQLKLAMLALWTVGIVAYFLALSRLLGNSRSFWITLILILIPAWAASSMKAWSGYITSFAASAVLLNLLLQYRDRPRAVVWLMSGALTSVIYFAQPLWLPGLLPIVIFFMFAQRRLSFGFLYLAGIAGVILVIRMISAGSVSDYWTPPGIGNPNLMGSLPTLFEQLYVSLTGFYYLRFRFDPGPVTRIVACIWFGILIAAMPLQIYRLVSKRYFLWSHLLFVSVLSTLLANWLLLDARDARYLLPVSGLLVLLAGVELFDLVDRRVFSDQRSFAAIVVVLVLGAISMIEFREFSYMWKNPTNSLNEAERMKRVINYMKAKGVKHAFSMHGLLQWQIMFYSDEEIISRWTSEVDRYPAYVMEVDRALQGGDTVALVGYVGSTGGLENIVANPKAIFTVDDRYFVYIGPDKELLMKMNFRFVN